MINESIIKSDLAKIVSKIMKAKKGPDDWRLESSNCAPYGEGYFDANFDTEYAFTTRLDGQKITLSYSNQVYNTWGYKKTIVSLKIEKGRHKVSWERIKDDDLNDYLYFNGEHVCRLVYHEVLGIDSLLRKVKGLYEKSEQKHKQEESRKRDLASDKIIQLLLKGN